MPKSSLEQSELPLTGSIAQNGTTKAMSKPHKPATELMKTVASKTLNEKNMKKVFSQDEIDEILARRDSGLEITPLEHKAIRERYRKIKRRAKELEKGNQGRLIVVPSIVTGDGFYKVFDFSTLYYVYRLADRMGRSAWLLSDNDRFSKMVHMASITNIDKFISQMKYFEDADLEITEDDIHIFELKKPLTDDEVGQLRMIEETRREKLHNVLKPKTMDPAVYQSILMIIRQVAPRVKKLDRHYYYAIGEDTFMVERMRLLRNLRPLLRNKKQVASDFFFISANVLLIGVSYFAVFLRRLFFFAVFLRHQFFVAVILTPKIVFLLLLSCKYHHFYGYYEKHGIMVMYKVNKTGNFYV